MGDERRSTVRVFKPWELRPVAGHVAVAWDKLMLVWGGYCTPGTESYDGPYCSPKELLVYDTVLDKWLCFETTGDMPQENSGAVAVLVDTTLYVFGGFCDSEDYAHLYALNLLTLTWTHLEPSGMLVPTVRHKLVGWHYNNKLYYFGGFGPPPEESLPLNRKMRYLRSGLDFVYDTTMMNACGWNSQLISFDRKTNAWELAFSFGDRPSARAAHSAAYIAEKEKVIVFGGRLQDQRMNDMYMLDLPSMTWAKIETNSGPCGRSWHSAVALDPNRILLFGGFTQNCIPLDDCWYFDISERRWTQVERESIKKPRLWHTAIVIDRACYVFGGCKNNILDTVNTVRRFSNEVLVIPAVPKPLFQQCLKFVDENRDLYSKRFAQLPYPLYEKLQFIASDRRQKSVKTPVDLLRL